METPQIKKTVSEPRVYALVVTSAHGQVLHIGVHFSLDEAYAMARKRLEALSPHTPGESIDIDLWNCLPARILLAQIADPNHVDEFMKILDDLPTKNNQTVADSMGSIQPDALPLPIPEILFGLMQRKAPDMMPSGVSMLSQSITNDPVEDMKNAKNMLMKKIIADGDLAQVEKFKSYFNSYDRRFLIDAIQKKQFTKFNDK